MAVLDIDGTLVCENDFVSQKTIDVIKKMQSDGYIVTICTGRNVKKALPVAHKIGVNIPIACIDGAIIYDVGNKNIVSGLPLTKSEVFSLIEVAREANVYVEVNDGFNYIKYVKNKELEKYDYLNVPTAFGRIKSLLGGVRYVKSFDDLFKLDLTFYQVVFGGEPEEIARLCKELLSKGFDNIDFRDLIWKEYLLINRSGISKTTGVKRLCEYFNIDIKDVVAIGDERNDLDMIEAVGMGVAMGNAVDSLKEIADYITQKNTEDGVALALEKFFLTDKGV